MKALIGMLLLLAQATATPAPKTPPAAAEKEAPPAATKPATPAKEEAKSTPEGIAIAEKVQKFYEKTSDFSASFKQAWKMKGLLRKTEASGTMKVKKPGFMRWDYTTPVKKLFVLDGKSAYTYVPEDKTVQVKENFSSNDLSAAVLFLWGKGNLVDSFHVTKAAKQDEGMTVLQLIPKTEEKQFSKLFFSVDDATGSVVRSVVIDSAGNENRVTFSDIKTNQKTPDSEFEFKIPKGVQVQKY